MDEDIERIIDQKYKHKKVSPEQEALSEEVSRIAEPLNRMIGIAHEVNPNFGKHMLISTTFAFIMTHSKNIDQALNTLEEIRQEIIQTDQEVNK